MTQETKAPREYDKPGVCLECGKSLPLINGTHKTDESGFCSQECDEADLKKTWVNPRKKYWTRY